MAYKFSPDTGVTIHEIPPGGLRISSEAILLNGPEIDRFEPWALPRIETIIRRITPFATCWCAPRFHVEGVDGSDGAAHPAADTIVIASDVQSLLGITVTAYHEAAHLIEANVSDEFLYRWASFTKNFRWDDDYLDNVREKRVRLFQFYAEYLDHGGQVNLTPGSTAEVLHPIYTGEIGRGVVARRERLAIADARATRPGIWNRIRNAA